MSPCLSGWIASRIRLAPALGLLLAAVAGCTLPTFKGPQLQEPPLGFYRVPDAGQRWRMFPDREPTHYDVWVNAAWGDVTTIHINGYPGRMMRADVQDALDAAVDLMADSVSISGLQQFTIDGRTGWGWAERFQTPTRGLVWIGLRVAVPYDTVTYTLEINSGDPALKRNPDTLITMAATFGVGEVRWNIPLILAIVLAAVVVVSLLRKRARERAARMKDIKFVKIPTADEEEEKRLAEEAGKLAEEAGKPEEERTEGPAPGSGEATRE